MNSPCEVLSAVHGACALPAGDLLKDVATHSDSHDHHRPHAAGGLLGRTAGQGTRRVNQHLAPNTRISSSTSAYLSLHSQPELLCLVPR